MSFAESETGLSVTSGLNGAITLHTLTQGSGGINFVVGTVATVYGLVGNAAI